MPTDTVVMEYSCPCCNSGLKFGQEQQKLVCDSCGNEFDIDAVKQFSEENPDDAFVWEDGEEAKWTAREEELPFRCSSCGALFEADGDTVATFCSYCDSHAVLLPRLKAGLKPDGVIPFKKTKEEAQEAYKKLCKRKPLLPKDYADQKHLDTMQCHYIPFWLYDCDATKNGKYRATRVHHWSDSMYNYTKTDYFLLSRAASAKFRQIPMDGSTKMDDSIMESIEPFDFGQIVDFEPAYLSGYLADKYNVQASDGKERIRERVGETLSEMIIASCIGYTSVIPLSSNLQVSHGKAGYVLLPVWVLTSTYKDKKYMFAMNGQTGKITGTFPICPKKTAAWFCGIMAAVSAITGLIAHLIAFGGVL